MTSTPRRCRPASQARRVRWAWLPPRGGRPRRPRRRRRPRARRFIRTREDCGSSSTTRTRVNGTTLRWVHRCQLWPGHRPRDDHGPPPPVCASTDPAPIRLDRPRDIASPSQTPAPVRGVTEPLDRAKHPLVSAGVPMTVVTRASRPDRCIRPRHSGAWAPAPSATRCRRGSDDRARALRGPCRTSERFRASTICNRAARATNLVEAPVTSSSSATARRDGDAPRLEPLMFDSIVNDRDNRSTDSSPL